MNNLNWSKMMEICLSCEHAVNYVPPAYRPLFQQNPDILDTHEAIDFGALEIAKILNQKLNCGLMSATVTRLLIDCNRSLDNPFCFSPISKSLSLIERQQLIEDYYFPFRQAVEMEIAEKIKRAETVLHLSIHSFTPVLAGKIRQADLGILYDPKRKFEKQIATVWKLLLKKQGLQVRCNYPYKGISDGFTTALRKQYSAQHYIGLEIEMNQALLKDQALHPSLSELLYSSLSEILASNH